MLFHSKVDDGGLCGRLWRVVGVGHLGGDVEPEVGVVLHLLVTHFDGSALLDGVATQDGVQHRIHSLTQAFQQHHVSVAHGTLDDVQVAFLSQADHLKQNKTTCVVLSMMPR